MADPSPIDIQKALGGMEYPASKEDLVKHAQDKGADESITLPGTASIAHALITGWAREAP